MTYIYIYIPQIIYFIEVFKADCLTKLKSKQKSVTSV